MIIERLFPDIKGELTKEDAAYVAVIISMLVASVFSFSIGSPIAEFFGAIFGAVGIISALKFISIYNTHCEDYFDEILPALFKMEILSKELGPYFPLNILISSYEQVRLKAIRCRDFELAKELENKINELKKLESEYSK